MWPIVKSCYMACCALVLVFTDVLSADFNSSFEYGVIGQHKGPMACLTKTAHYFNYASLPFSLHASQTPKSRTGVCIQDTCGGPRRGGVMAQTE